VLEDLPDFKL